MASREQIIEALFNVLKASVAFKTASRRNLDPEGLDPSQSPAMFLLEHVDGWDRAAGYNELPKRTIELVAILYNDVGTDVNALPNAPINDAIDAFEAAMQPDDPINGTFTLGGLVKAVTIDGTTQRGSGDTTGKALAVMPIRILIP